MDGTVSGMDEVMSKILTRVAVGFNWSRCSTQEGLNEALKPTDVSKELS